MSKGTAVAVKDEGQLPVSQAQLAQYAEDAGQGLEGIGVKDIAIPYIGQIQALSKQLEEGHMKYLPDAKVGSIFNTVTNEVFSAKEGILVVPTVIEKVVVEKEPKKENGKGGGKIIAVYANRSEAQTKKQRDSELLDGYRVIVLYQTKGGAWVPAVLSMGTKSKIYAMKNWNALMSGLTVDGPNGTKIHPPTFAWTYRITSAQMEFTDGTSAVFKIVPAGAAPDDVYQQAKDIRKAVSAGAVKLGADEEATPPQQQDDDLPY